MTAPPPFTIDSLFNCILSYLTLPELAQIATTNMRFASFTSELIQKGPIITELNARIELLRSKALAYDEQALQATHKSSQHKLRLRHSTLWRTGRSLGNIIAPLNKRMDTYQERYEKDSQDKIAQKEAVYEQLQCCLNLLERVQKNKVIELFGTLAEYEKLPIAHTSANDEIFELTQPNSIVVATYPNQRKLILLRGARPFEVPLPLGTTDTLHIVMGENCWGCDRENDFAQHLTHYNWSIEEKSSVLFDANGCTPEYSWLKEAISQCLEEIRHKPRPNYRNYCYGKILSLPYGKNEVPVYYKENGRLIFPENS